MLRKPRFHKAAFPEITDALPNPFRGYYQIYAFDVETNPKLEALQWCLRAEETVALVLLDIGAYRNRDLDEAALTHIREILGFFGGWNKDILLRVTYDTQGKCTEREPSLFRQILAHIEQLGPALRTYRDRIVFFEGMLVGNWGEMHGSRFLTKDHIQRLNGALERWMPGILRAVRRPDQWRMLHAELPAQGPAVGLYNDGIFGSETDLGTFAAAGSDSEHWEQPWPAERELAFEESLSAFAPQCGEAVFGESYRTFTLRSTAERLRKMGLTCLNGVYDERLLGIWKGWTWTGDDAWNGVNGYDYIGRLLGYRFCVRDAGVKIKGNHCQITLTVENVGFSGFYQEAEARLVLSGAAGQQTYMTPWDVRSWKSGQKTTLTWQIPAGEGALYLSVRRKWDSRAVWFANPSTPQGWVLLGNL